MPYAREPIYQALFAKGVALTWNSTVTPGRFITTGRRVKLFSDVDAQQQPALFQAEHGEAVTQQTRMPSKLTLMAKWVIYHPVAKDSNAVPAIENNLILDAIMATLAPPPGQDVQTLGGLVHHCWADGEFFKDPGDIDGQAMIVVPINILVP